MGFEGGENILLEQVLPENGPNPSSKGRKLTSNARSSACAYDASSVIFRGSGGLNQAVTVQRQDEQPDMFMSGLSEEIPTPVDIDGQFIKIQKVRYSEKRQS